MEKKINEKKSLLREAEKLADKRERRPRHRSPVSAIFTKIIMILMLIIIILGGGYIFFMKHMQPKKEVNTIIVEQQLSYCQELVTVKYRYSDIVSLKKSLALSKSFSIVKFSGIIRIGIPDVTLCDYEVYNDGKAIKIKIPEVEVLGNDITSQEVFDESHSIFVPITLDEVFTEIEKQKSNTLDDLINEGVMKEARENAKKVIQQVMMSAGFEEVIVL